MGHGSECIGGPAPLVVTRTRSGESARTMTVDHTTESKNPTTRSEKVWFPGKGRQGRSAYALYSPHQARQVPSQVKTWTET